MVGTEQEALAHAVTECATGGSQWEIKASDGRVIWSIERDNKVDESDLSWPVIVHLRGALATDAIAILEEIAAQREP